ncbi:MAG: GNAT family N-acetyltransferase [Sulfitobacter sp.]|nr:GNAT family N-acetyltransferase [Sulfitobacter sp.]
MSRTIPTINTPRLTLRAMRAEDFARFAAIWAEPSVVEHIAGGARTKAQSWDAFLRNAGHWQITGFGQWGIQPRGAQALAGQAGFFFGTRGFGKDFDPYPEAAWVLAPEHQGKGLGLDAVRAAHDWFDRIVTGRTVAVISPDHYASLRVATRLGYTVMREETLQGEEVLLLTRKGPPA